MHATNPHEEQRQVRGLAIASIGSCIKRINKLHYKVKSQSDAWKWYEVVKQYGRNVGGHQEGEWTTLNIDI
ncbi:MAG: hypothetical protein WCF23_14945 [Candidatus Nitrosopolaris sp.]